MRRLLKVLVPPLVGFAAYFIAVRYSSEYFTLRTDEMGEGTVQSFMAYFKFFWPLLLTVAVLTQLLIVVPIWYRLFVRSRKGKLTSLFLLIFICLLFAGGISYTIWDKQNGTEHLIKEFVFMTTVQLIYWAVNLFMLYLLTKKKPEQATEEPDTAVE
jgi:glucan phosphoethanolaminetransferase (alkaline phosphatase superfamily)